MWFSLGHTFVDHNLNAAGDAAAGIHLRKRTHPISTEATKGEQWRASCCEASWMHLPNPLNNTADDTLCGLGGSAFSQHV